MPTYEYACTSCGDRLEVVQSFNDDPLTECPACGAPLRKVFGSVGIVLKGSGFYKTDSRETTRPARTKGSDAGSSTPTATRGESTSTSSAEGGGSGPSGGAKDAGAGPSSPSAPAKAPAPSTAG